MDATKLDRIAKRFAARRLSRRRAMAQGGAGLAAGALAAAGLAHSTSAQDATPPAGEAGDKTMFLFVQSFQGGSVAPTEGAQDRYTLTLAQGLGQTIYFSDRPERLVGASPTPQFLEGLGFSEENPPNAALVVEGADGQTEIAVVELYDPSYDEATHTATYEVAALAEWEDALGVGLTETPADLAALGSSFGAAHLFIDDCAPLGGCYGYRLKLFGPVPGGPYGQCWSWDNWQCLPSNSPCNGPTIDALNAACNREYGDKCGPGPCFVG